MKQVVIYTDGACSGNPGKGGYGAVLLYKGHRKELSCGFKHTTNNRMELLSVIRALQSLTEPCSVTLYSDSRYVVDSVTKGWVYGWQNKNWMRKSDAVPNTDLWKMLLPLLKQHDVTFVWVKGHADNVENERCDFLARTAIECDELLDDLAVQGNF